MLSDDLVRGQAQHLIGALIAHEFLPKAMPNESYIVLWDVVIRQLKCVNREGARAIESAACAERDARIAELELELEEARKDAERWAPISGYEDSYEVSSLGRVRSLNRVDTGGNKRAGRFMTPSAIRKGYLKVSLNKGNVAVEMYVHRLVATAFVENPLNLPQVNHKDGDPANNAVSNLEWVTNAENQTHARRVLAKGVRAVYGISKENGSRVDFGTLAEAEEAGFKRANIQKCIAGVRSHHQGYAWFDAAIRAAIKEQTK